MPGSSLPLEVALAPYYKILETKKLLPWLPVKGTAVSISATLSFTSALAYSGMLATRTIAESWSRPSNLSLALRPFHIATINYIETDGTPPRERLIPKRSDHV